MPARKGPKKVNQYSNELKRTAVRLSNAAGVKVKDVAEALDIHPFMLSRWRKEAREGLLVELHRFYVDRAAHGSGVARELMLAVHGAARDLGGHHLWLGVWERNPRAIASYAKSGFVHVGSHDFFVGADRQTDQVFVSPRMSSPS